MVQNKKIKKNNGYDSSLPIRIPSRMTGVLINKNHDRVVSKAGIDVLKSNYKMYESDNSLHNIPLVVKAYLTACENMNVPLRSGHMRNHHDILMSSGEDSQETHSRSQDGDKDVSNFMSDMLTKYQVHKESDDHFHEDVEVVTAASNSGGIDNHDHALEDMQTLIEGVISKNESILLVCATNYKEYMISHLGASCCHRIKKLYVIRQ